MAGYLEFIQITESRFYINGNVFDQHLDLKALFFSNTFHSQGQNSLDMLVFFNGDVLLH